MKRWLWMVAGFVALGIAARIALDSCSPVDTVLGLVFGALVWELVKGDDDEADGDGA